jgi:hypothetical protein
VCVILLVVIKFIVMKAEHTVAIYNGRGFTSKFATVQYSGRAIVIPLAIEFRVNLIIFFGS